MLATTFQPLAPSHNAFWQVEVPLPEAKLSFSNLVQAIRKYLGPSSGIDSDEIDHHDLIALMQHYKSDHNEWARYSRSEPGKNYTRNTVDNCNGKANLLLLVWNPQKGSPVHDHANAHCIMKILQGSLTETVYHNPSDAEHDAEHHELGSQLNIKKETVYSTDEVTYISDKIGLHRVANATDEIAISLHLYTPPNAADFGYNIYDPKTGKSSHVRQA